MTQIFDSMDDVFDRLIEIDEKGDFYWIDGAEDCVGLLKSVMRLLPGQEEEEWLSCSYIMLSTWSDYGRGDYEPCFSLHPVNAELDGVIDHMQCSLDHAGGDYGIYDVRLIDVETGKVSRPQITSIELVD